MGGPNDTVHWRRDLGGGTTVALIQAGSFRSDAGTLFGPVPWVLWRPWAEGELDENRRLTQALNCLLIETAAGRVLVETGIGERFDDKTREQRDVQGPWVVPALETAEAEAVRRSRSQSVILDLGAEGSVGLPRSQSVTLKISSKDG